MTKKERKKLDAYYTRKYGITYSQYELQWEQQGRVCALCKREKRKDQKRFAQDHDHKSGKNRGIVCYYCNKFRIGRHNYDSAAELFKYMVKYNG